MKVPTQRVDTYIHRMPRSAGDRGQEFAELIRGARIQANLTQDEVVARSGVSTSTLIRWENGRAERPDPDQVRALCITLGIDPSRAAIALGYLRQEDLPAPDTGGRKLDPRIMEVIEALEDPHVSEEQKQQWVRYLMFLRQQARPSMGERSAG